MFCISCGTKADEGDKFCLKCGKPIAAPPDAAPTYTAEPKTADPYAPPEYDAPPKASDPYAPTDAAPAYDAQPKASDPYAPPDAAPTYTAELKTADPYAPPAYNAQPYHAPQSVIQGAKPASGRKGILTPVIIASVAVVAVALIAVVLFFALGSGTKDQSDEGPGDSMSDTEEAGLSADDDIDSEPDSEPDPEPEDSPPPEEDEVDEVEEEAEEDEAGDFILTEDGSGFIFNGVEFQLNDVDLKPIFAPAYMQDGHVPFMVNFIMTNHPDQDEVMSLLYKVGYFMVGDEKAEFGAALLGDENINQSIYSLVSSCTRIDDNSPITLYIGDNAFIVR